MPVGPEKLQFQIINLFSVTWFRLNESWFVIYDEVLNFHGGILWFHEPFHDEKKIQKSIELSMDLRHWNNMKAILSFWTPNYVDSISFLLLIISIFFTIEPNNFKKPYSVISEKHDQSSINWTNVFNFIG